MSKNKLGVVYSANFIKKSLRNRIPGDGYVPVGLLLKAIKSKELLVETLLYNKRTKNVISREPDFSSEPILQNETGKYISSKAGTKTLPEPDMVSNLPDEQARIKDSSVFQFWEVMYDNQNNHLKPLVYFSRNDLELLLMGDVEEVTFSGAQIHYGIGLRDFEAEQVDNENKSAYPTLKVESNLDNEKEGELIPNVAIALPCPPVWEDKDREKENNESVDIVHRILRSIEMNYEQFAESDTRLIKVGGEEKEMLQNLASFLDSK